MITGGRYDKAWNPHATSELITLNEDLSISSTYGPTFPMTVWGHSMINLNGSIYLFGGYQNNVTSKNVWILDGKTLLMQGEEEPIWIESFIHVLFQDVNGHWRQGLSMRFERRWLSVGAFKTDDGRDQIVVASGPINGDKVEVFDVKSGEWTLGI